METGRTRVIYGVAAILAMLLACASKSPFPETITFGSEQLSRADSWTRGGMSGAVYLAPGEKLPDAALQVGAIVSTEHTTATALQSWVAEQYSSSGVSPMHNSDGVGGESCKAGMAPVGSGTRQFMTVQLCKTGVKRAACVEADETMDNNTFGRCVATTGCFEDECDKRWLERGDALEALITTVLNMP